MGGNSAVLMGGVVACCLGVEEGYCCCGVGGGDGQTVALWSVNAEGFSVSEHQTDRAGSSYSDAPTEELGQSPDGDYFGSCSRCGRYRETAKAQEGSAGQALVIDGDGPPAGDDAKCQQNPAGDGKTPERGGYA